MKVCAPCRALCAPAAEGREANAATFRSTSRIVASLVEEETDEDTRAILCDDTSMDFLTNAEMSQALKVAMFAADEADAVAIFADEARRDEIMATGVEGALRRLDVIGMDACLMAMLEVQYQIRQFADILVSSQDVEPIDGWPYTELLQRLAANPMVGPVELGAIAVEEYERSYFSKSVTQSAVKLGQMEETSRLVSDFANALNSIYATDNDLQNAWLRATNAGRRTFEDREYLDLLTFVEKLLEQYKGSDAGLGTAGAALTDHLRSADGPVASNAATGKLKGKATGISIYVPETVPSPLYEQIDFASSGWLEFLRTVYNTSLA